jgi:hypothetical protein
MFTVGEVSGLKHVASLSGISLMQGQNVSERNRLALLERIMVVALSACTLSETIAKRGRSVSSR